MILNIFYMLTDISISFLGKYLFKSCAHLKICCCCWVLGILYTFWILIYYFPVTVVTPETISEFFEGPKIFFLSLFPFLIIIKGDTVFSSKSLKIWSAYLVTAHSQRSQHTMIISPSNSILLCKSICSTIWVKSLAQFISNS